MGLLRRIISALRAVAPVAAVAAVSGLVASSTAATEFHVSEHLVAGIMPDKGSDATLRLEAVKGAVKGVSRVESSPVVITAKPLWPIPFREEHEKAVCFHCSLAVRRKAQAVSPAPSPAISIYF